MVKDPIQIRRFSNRAENYARYRTSYPEAVVSFLEKTFNLINDQWIADIGSGTGLFTELLLKRGYNVVGIEPNEQMRIAAELRLGSCNRFVSRNRSAEDTGLRRHSIDMITVAQAFHWLNADAARKEFTRILKPGAPVVLGWNVRKKDEGFMEKFECLKTGFGIDYNPALKINDAAIRLFFQSGRVRSATFSNTQWLDFDSLKGQLLSSPYIPLPGHKSYDAMISELISLFVNYNVNGAVRMDYETRLYWAHIS
jgi:SAM-dependent methyltransferase